VQSGTRVEIGADTPVLDVAEPSVVEGAAVLAEKSVVCVLDMVVPVGTAIERVVVLPPIVVWIRPTDGAVVVEEEGVAVEEYQSIISL
jgi:hypothetical protein